VQFRSENFHKNRITRSWPTIVISVGDLHGLSMDHIRCGEKSHSSERRRSEILPTPKMDFWPKRHTVDFCDFLLPLKIRNRRFGSLGPSPRTSVDRLRSSNVKISTSKISKFSKKFSKGWCLPKIRAFANFTGL